MKKFSKRIVVLTEDGRSSVVMLRLSIELGEDLAYLDWEPSGELYYIKVPAKHRRKGIATMLWNSAQEHAKKSGLPPLTHSKYRTEEGDAWAQSLGEELSTKISA